MNMLLTKMQVVPGYRGMIRPVEEAGGPLLLLSEVLETEPMGQMMKMIDLGLTLYAAGETVFVTKGDLALCRELLIEVERAVAMEAPGPE